MAGATIWKGIIHFGDMDLPVKLHTAVGEERTQFHLLHDRDQVRVRQQMICALDKLPVPAEEQFEGIRDRGRKIHHLRPRGTRTDRFGRKPGDRGSRVRQDRPDRSIFLGRVYYLEPDVQAKGYAAFARTLRELEVSGICTWNMRKRSYLGALQASGDVIRLNTLRYADEVVRVDPWGCRTFPCRRRS